MPRLCSRLIDLLCLPGRWVSWLTLPLILAIIVSVISAAAGVTVLADWDGTLPILGKALTVNTLTDVQWYIFALLVLFGGVWALRDDAHVSVDFLSLMMSRKQRLWVRVFGDLGFLLPFSLIICWYGYGFTQTAFRTGEGSTQGGLDARWIIKAALPVCFGMLAVFGVVRGIGTLIWLARGGHDGTGDNDTTTKGA
ncbi:TRAP transporter small permease subunit [Stappia sp. ICDLI1TA098]|jgi:TRAP-type mannitol/chloroaromatic compound transport system permease small subunit